MFYETVLAEPAGEIARMVDFLGLENFDPARVDLGAIAIKQQRDEESQKMKQRFIDEFYMQ